jgi:hypothetical protein
MTKMTGILWMLFGAVVLMIAITNYSPQSTAAGGVADHQASTGLTTNTTDLRMAMGAELLIQVLVAAVLGIVGWFLYGSETDQWGYVIATGVLIVIMGAIRMTPLVPFATARKSPGTLFYGTVLKIAVVQDQTSYYVTLPDTNATNNYRVAAVDTAAPEGQGVILLDFHGDTDLFKAYMSASAPATMLVTISGTATIVRGAHINFLIPKAKVTKVGDSGS